jgi:23S rRNA (adenine2030-N6)-methyltransferase
MNYRHAYHAGNFADVLKHAVLARVIEHLKLKPAPFRIIDTHAGIGIYDLASAQAQKTGEWRDGIARLFDGRDLPGEAAALLAPYLDVVRGCNPAGRLERYPGSPLIARRLMRAGDQLVLNELHPDDGSALDRLMRREPDTKVLRLDAWMALKSLLPPKERRGAILIDPPFEEPGELERLIQGLGAAARRFATGTYMVWYPIKDAIQVRRFERAVAGLGLPKLLGIELLVRNPAHAERLNGCGLIVLNPPFRLRSELDVLLPFLADSLAQGPDAQGRARMLRD